MMDFDLSVGAQKVRRFMSEGADSAYRLTFALQNLNKRLPIEKASSLEPQAGGCAGQDFDG